MTTKAEQPFDCRTGKYISCRQRSYLLTVVANFKESQSANGGSTACSSNNSGQMDQDHEGSPPEIAIEIIDEVEDDTETSPIQTLKDSSDQKTEEESHPRDDGDPNQQAEPVEADRTTLETSSNGAVNIAPESEQREVWAEEIPPLEEPQIQQDLSEAWQKCQISNSENPFAQHIQEDENEDTTCDTYTYFFNDHFYFMQSGRCNSTSKLSHAEVNKHGL